MIRKTLSFGFTFGFAIIGLSLLASRPAAAQSGTGYANVSGDIYPGGQLWSISRQGTLTNGVASGLAFLSGPNWNSSGVDRAMTFTTNACGDVHVSIRSVGIFSGLGFSRTPATQYTEITRYANGTTTVGIRVARTLDNWTFVSTGAEFPVSGGYVYVVAP